MMPQLPSAPPETILEWWLNRPAACLFAYAGLALFYALVAFGESLAVEPRPVRRSLRYRIRARRISIGALHTAIWSLAGAIYLTIGPDVGVIPTDGSGWILVAATYAMYFFLLWVMGRSDSESRMTYSEQESGWWVDPDKVPSAARRQVDHQAVRDAVLHWWEHRGEPRGPYEPGQQVGYMPREDRSEILRHLAGRVGSVLQTLAVDQRLIQFGGEEDGTVIVHIVAELDELLPM